MVVVKEVVGSCMVVVGGAVVVVKEVVGPVVVDP